MKTDNDRGKQTIQSLTFIYHTLLEYSFININFHPTCYLKKIYLLSSLLHQWPSQGQKATSGVIFHHFWDRSPVQCFGPQSSWPLGFKGFSCVHLPSCHRTLALQIGAIVARFMWILGLQTQVHVLAWQVFTCWSIFPVPSFRSCFEEDYNHT